MSESHKGYVKTDEHRKHLSESKKGKPISKEHREKCRVVNQGSKQKTAKYTEEIIEKVKIDIINGVSVSDISEKYNIPYRYIYSGIMSDRRWKHVRPEGWDQFLENKRLKAI